MKRKTPDQTRDAMVPQKIRILCVDDNVPVLTALASGLRQHGFEVVTAGDGCEAFHQFEEQSQNFHVILTDHDMPQMNGLEFVRRVRGTGFAGPILVISGSLELDDTTAYSQYSISDFFAKPYHIELLVHRILQVTLTPQERSLPNNPLL